MSKYLDGESQRIYFAEGYCSMHLLNTYLSHPSPSAPAASAHHPRRLPLAAQQQQESGICPHGLQRPAVLTRQGAEGQTLRHHQNALPQSKPALLLTQRWESSVSPGHSAFLVCVISLTLPRGFQRSEGDQNTLPPLDSNCDSADYLEVEHFSILMSSDTYTFSFLT